MMISLRPTFIETDINIWEQISEEKGVLMSLKGLLRNTVVDASCIQIKPRGELGAEFGRTRPI